MSRKNLMLVMLVGVIMASVVLPLAMAEEVSRRPQGRQATGARGDATARGAQGQRGPGGFDFQARMNEMMKEELGASDGEWKVIEPRLTKVMELQRSSSRGGMGMMMGRMMMRGNRGGGPGGMAGPGGDRGNRTERTDRGTTGDRGARGGQPADQGEQTEVQKTQQALSEVLEKEDAAAADINAKLLAFRKAKQKAQQALATAKKELKDVLTVRQEAKLVLYGMLD